MSRSGANHQTAAFLPTPHSKAFIWHHSNDLTVSPSISVQHPDALDFNPSGFPQPARNRGAFARIAESRTLSRRLGRATPVWRSMGSKGSISGKKDDADRPVLARQSAPFRTFSQVHGKRNLQPLFAFQASPVATISAKPRLMLRMSHHKPGPGWSLPFYLKQVLMLQGNLKALLLSMKHWLLRKVIKMQ